MLDAARTLIEAKGDEFTTQELAAEAGVALQTFYRYFASKDELLLAVIGDAMTDAVVRWAETASELPDPLARLKYYITSTLARLNGDSHDAAMSKFVVSTRWRLHQAVPQGTRRGREAVRRSGAQRGELGHRGGLAQSA